MGDAPGMYLHPKYVLYAFIAGFLIRHCAGESKAADYQVNYLIKQPYQVIEKFDAKQVTLDELIGGQNELEKHN